MVRVLGLGVRGESPRLGLGVCGEWGQVRVRARCIYHNFSQC